MRPGQPGDAVQEDDDVHPVLHQPLRPLQHHVGDADVVFRRHIKRRADHFPVDGALHVRHFFGALIDEEHHQLDFRVICR